MTKSLPKVDIKTKIEEVGIELLRFRVLMAVRQASLLRALADSQDVSARCRLRLTQPQRSRQGHRM